LLIEYFNKTWAVILGGSGGIGLATARLLASKGMNIFIVHRDTRDNCSNLYSTIEILKKYSVSIESININVNDFNNKEKILSFLKSVLAPGEKIRLFLHAISDGNLKAIFNKDKLHETDCLSMDDYNYTINAMGLSFVFWSRTLFDEGYLPNKSRIVGITSEGRNIVLPNYAAVSSAKSVLESACKYMAVELAKNQITVNLINAGITNTRALSAFPNYEDLLKKAVLRNPSGRLTTPDDIAKVVFLLCLDEADWITGEIIRVDGGEQLLNVF